MPSSWKMLSVAMGSLLTGVLLMGLVMSLPDAQRSDAYAQQVRAAQAAQENLQTAHDFSFAFRSVTEALRPSVVSIAATKEQRPAMRGGGGLPPGLLDQLPPWMREDLLREFGGRRGRPEPPREPQRRPSGMGSGVIIRADGYILTNNHVVADADEVHVGLSDGRRVQAEVVGTDPQTDIAVLKIDVGNLQAAPLGDSEAVHVGEWVLAMGSPFALEQTVTAGIISAKNRVQNIVDGGEGFEDFLQTDAAINPGNSGGPLVNLHGEVIGINTAILSRTGGFHGIGFAIPTSLAAPVANSLIETGEVRRGFLGAQVADVTEEIAEDRGVAPRQGAYVQGVLEGRPAAEGGLQPGDIIRAIDGRRIRSGTQLRNYVASRPPGSTLSMAVIRNGQELELEITLGERTQEAMAQFGQGEGDLFGARVQPLDPETANQLGYDEAMSGLVIVEVEDDTRAAEAGLEVGDVVLSVNGRPVESVEEMDQALRAGQARGRATQLIIRRGNVRALVTIR